MAHSSPIISSSFCLQVLPRNFPPATIQPSILTVASKSPARSTNIRCQAITKDANTLSSLISDLEKNKVAQESNQVQHGHLPDEQVAARWREIHGCNNWYGLLDPMDPVLRTELIRYGEFTQATYDGFDYNPLSPNCGSSMYPHDNFFEGLGINGTGYDITRFLYATAHFKLPNFGISSRHPEKWSNRACWVGFVAVSGDEATKRLGRRDIVVAWRGTVTQLEWVADLMSYLQPVVGKGISCPDAAAKVEAGFLEYYAEKDPSCEYCKYSAREQVLTEVKKLIDLYSKAGEEVSISITGHSLGSALAMLSAYDMAETGVNMRASGERVSTCVISFAGPRLGNQRFKERFENLGIKALRVVNVHDGVPKVPGLVLNEKFPEFMRKVGVGLPESYTHIGEELLLDNTHSPYLKQTSDPAALHNMEVYLHLIDGYQGKGRKFAATPDDQSTMAAACGHTSLDSLIDATVPKSIRAPSLTLPKFDAGLTESQMLAHMARLASKNRLFKSFIGMGYYNTFVPAVILRNIMENPGWYTQYTPYQAEIAQGRLESLLNFQTMITDLTALPMSNASLLDEGTAAAEAMAMCNNIYRGRRKTFLVASNCHPQTLDVCRTRADGFDLKVVSADVSAFDYSSGDVCGVLVQYPGTEGEVLDYAGFIKDAHAHGVKVVMATDLLALTVLKPPGELGADIVVGSAQRFGVPMGYGGPHAAFLATSQEYKRIMPGRIIGLSVDSTGKPALRMAMQTREQHIRRDKATSNICTAQALLANMAAMYAVYHGPEGLKAIAHRVHGLAGTFALGVKKLGTAKVQDLPFFDTVKVTCDNAQAIADAAKAKEMNLRVVDANTITLSFDETTTLEDVDKLFEVFSGGKPVSFTAESLASEVQPVIPSSVARESPYLTHQIFNSYHTEHELLRYLHRLQAKDLSLCHSMIPLGSCTMKLNATVEMMPVTWPNFADLHPFAPTEQALGYQEMFEDLGDLLCTITGFDSFSLQPNAGAAGEYAGLMVIRAYHIARGDTHRNVCIIPVSAHGTNPASAAMCGMKIVAVGTDSKGNINIEELRKAAETNKDHLAALMVTYPSTHGVYEEGIDEICKIIHDNGGQVYMDGANMNAQVGLTSPGFIGADVCHLNLHKTFCIPHGGGGPGMGPIGVKKHLAPFLPSHPVIPTGGIPAPEKAQPLGTISAAPWGSALILPISYSYIAMMGSKGLTDASKIAILNANYMMKRLENHYPVLFRGVNGTVAHEFIIDLRGFKTTAGIEPEDVAKRLIDYGFHGPTMSWPVPGTLMIEPTESESKAELDRFCDALISIREEIAEIENGKADINNNVLKGAPHPPSILMGDTWNKPYSREYAAFPASWLRGFKFWPTTGRVDNVYGDRNLICTLLPVSQMADEPAAATA